MPARRTLDRRKSRLVGACMIGSLLLLALAALVLLPRAQGSSTLQGYARQIIATCSKDSYPPRCYDTEIPKLMDQGVSMEDTFAVTGIIQKSVPDYFYCHVLGHELASKETAKDPTKWTQVIARCPVGQCSNGCLHGAAQERYRNDVLTPQQQEAVVPGLAQVCSSATRNYTGFEQSSCFHSLGHLSMYLTGASIKKSLSICDIIATKKGMAYVQTCYEGAFMQIFQPLEPEDFGLVRDIAPVVSSDAEKFCDTFTGEARASCHRESWPLYHGSLLTASGLAHFCTLVNDPGDITRCYNAVFNVLAAQDNFEPGRIGARCTALPKEREAQCFANSASHTIETDPQLSSAGVALCKRADQEGVGGRCYDELLFYSTYSYHLGSPDFVAYCGALPDPWKGRCLGGDGLRIKIDAQ